MYKNAIDLADLSSKGIIPDLSTHKQQVGAVLPMLECQVWDNFHSRGDACV